MALCVAELTRAGLMLSSPDKTFFAPVCAVMAARQIFPISVPHKAVFCTEVMLPSLGRGLALLEQVPTWGHISSCSSGVLPSQGAFLQQAGLMHTPGRVAGQCWCVCRVAGQCCCVCRVAGQCCCVCRIAGQCWCVCRVAGQCCCVCRVAGQCCCVCRIAGQCWCVCRVAGQCCCVCRVAGQCCGCRTVLVCVQGCRTVLGVCRVAGQCCCVCRIAGQCWVCAGLQDSAGDCRTVLVCVQDCRTVLLCVQGCRTVLLCAGSGSPHPAPFSVVKSVLSVLPRSLFVLQLNNAWTSSLTPEMISKRI
ncbi:keratin-associated protein 5-9-like isoform X2 [Melozone crissalis]|uniref:keratin-associated protein 5-9-like isoform X2 n=1 Tax=Melozone crissalis TaxID=40204 RepID=UPI0023D981A0|nr:keratin-associated protein 5-9-like isoform X2 [Melozone crissalis]